MCRRSKVVIASEAKQSIVSRPTDWIASSLALLAMTRRETGSPLFRRNIPDARAMRGDIVESVFQMHALVRGQLFLGAHAGSPFPHRPYRPRGKSAAAVRTDIVEFALGAFSAKCAFVTADARFRCVGRKILVAIFAVRPKLQRHRLVFP